MQSKFPFFEEQVKDNKHPDKENRFTQFASPLENMGNIKPAHGYFNYDSHFKFPETSSTEATVENGGMRVNALQSFENTRSTDQLQFRTLRYQAPKKPSDQEEMEISKLLNF